MENSSLFVGDLSIFCEESSIHKLFSTYGEITDIKMMRDMNKILFAFVKYIDSVSAKNAMDTLNGTILLGRPLRYVYIYFMYSYSFIFILTHV